MKNNYLNKKGKFSYELALNTLKEIQPIVKKIANQENFFGQHINSNGEAKPISFSTLPLDLLFQPEQKATLKELAEGFLRGSGMEDSVSTQFVYRQLIDLCANEDFYLNEKLDNSSSLSFFEKLKNLLLAEINTTKIVIFTVLGASLTRGEKCNIGSIEFLNPQDFIDNYKDLFDAFIVKEQGFQPYIDSLSQCDIIATVKIKKRDTNIAEILANEIMKRVYTLVRLVIPMYSGRYNFFGSVGEEYLDSRFSFLFSAEQNNDTNINSIQLGRTRNYFSNRQINLLEVIRPYQTQKNKIWFPRFENLINKVVNNDQLNDFEKRLWTAFYWYGEAISEKEINPMIIKYTTCLEALFNSREGGISEQISEFTTHVAGLGKTKYERMEIYSHMKKLYSMRSSAVHGSSLVSKVDDSFILYTQSICETALHLMTYYSGERYYQDSKGYEKFTQYILREYRFL
ncbi:MAG TPA: hypothetical protein VK203_03425 [Nostocaceae cyanobacterium]|nr:hypothetical protein [Nostocaceae cyanobacterium]